MTNQQCNAITKAIITGFNTLARAHINAINASHSRQGAFLNTITEAPGCCALPIEPLAPMEAEPVDDGWYYLKPGDKLQEGDFLQETPEEEYEWSPVKSQFGHAAGNWPHYRFRRKVEPATINEVAF